jgi:serine protease AprX
MTRAHLLAKPARTLAIIALAVALAAALATVQRPAEAIGTGLLDDAVSVADGDVLAIVHPADGVALDAVQAAAGRLGLELAGEFPNVGVIGAVGPAVAFEALAATGLVSHVEEDAPLELFLDTSHKATRGAEVLAGELADGTPFTLPDGTIIDGDGIGVAVVDSGHDGTHPDLFDPTAGNEKIIFPTNLTVPFIDTDTISAGGHGTHVSGTVVSNGEEYGGAAPGASLYGVSAGTAISVHSALAGLEWVLANHDKVTPNIKVVNNSWGSGAAAYNPNSALSVATRNLINAGVTVVFAGGNSGGNGSVQQTSPTCIDPTPGVICVAAYDDANDGRRDGNIAGFSSRGRDGQPNTYPDISAPGTNIMASCRPYLPICATGAGGNDGINHFPLSGTSMAAPHIAGIAAQLYQVDPSLTPAEVEEVLQLTARKIEFGAAYEPDPQNPAGTTSFDKGHGLVDVVAAIEMVLDRSK